MRRRQLRPQFDPGSSGQGRRFERLFILHRGFNEVVSNVGKAALSCLIWPRLVAPFRWELTRHAMPLGGIDGAFVGYKILQLTDLHVGRVRLDYLERVFRRCLEEKPDLIVITGDLIDYDVGNVESLAPLVRLLVEARAPDGVAAIFGNHDYHEYSWRHNGKRSARRVIFRRLVKLLEETGVRVLRNEQYRIRRGAGELVVVGMDEMWADMADAERAFAGVRVTDAVVCLQHNPDGVELLREYPWQYMLCGHTHGGQANFPVMGPMYVPMRHREYLRGVFEFAALPGQGVKKRMMFVSRGLGYSYPIRMRCRPEATVFTVAAG